VQKAMPPQTPPWKTQPELAAIQITLQPSQPCTLPSNYTYWLHAWFLDQMRQIDPQLSAELHNNQTEKAFTLSGFLGSDSTNTPIPTHRTIQFGHSSYHCQITALNKTLCTALKNWQPPKLIRLQNVTFQIQQWQTSLPATSYNTLWKNARSSSKLNLTFLSPTAFHKNGNHMPLPIPENLFHSYLRRWNIFAHRQFAPEDFLEWVREGVVLLRHNIRSSKVQPGKQGSVTGFTGNIQLGFTNKAQRQTDYCQLSQALIAAAPYFGTGHKVTFGLGQTRSGWASPEVWLQNGDLPPTDTARSTPVTSLKNPSVSFTKKSIDPITARIAELQPIFLASKKRQGGDRAANTALLWATIIAHQENGDSLKLIAIALDMPYDSAKKCSQLARKCLLADEGRGKFRYNNGEYF
jgi:CRISPR-associated endoribonuclease Cas6